MRRAFSFLRHGAPHWRRVKLDGDADSLVEEGVVPSVRFVKPVRGG